jgi:hypothetical protein
MGKMEGYCSTGQSPHRAVVPVEEEEDVKQNHSFAFQQLPLLLFPRLRYVGSELLTTSFNKQSTDFLLPKSHYVTMLLWEQKYDIKIVNGLESFKMKPCVLNCRPA